LKEIYIAKTWVYGAFHNSLAMRGGKMGVSNFGTRIGWILCLVTATVLYGGLSAHALLGDKINEYNADQVRIDPDGKVVNGRR
jgi:hypothetical protein